MSVNTTARQTAAAIPVKSRSAFWRGVSAETLKHLLIGGVSLLFIFPFLWLVATRITEPLTWWRKVLPGKIQTVLAGLWPWTLGISAALLVFALEIATTGFVPAVNDSEVALSVMLICLGLEVVMFPLTFVSGFAHDIVLSPNVKGKATLQKVTPSPR